MLDLVYNCVGSPFPFDLPSSNVWLAQNLIYCQSQELCISNILISLFGSLWRSLFSVCSCIFTRREMQTTLSLFSCWWLCWVSWYGLARSFNSKLRHAGDYIDLINAMKCTNFLQECSWSWCLGPLQTTFEQLRLIPHQTNNLPSTESAGYLWVFSVLVWAHKGWHSEHEEGWASGWKRGFDPQELFQLC